jgi:hypothetical protein
MKILIVEAGARRYIAPVLRLTRHEQTVVCVVVLLLTVGWTVKAWRSAKALPLPVENVATR